MSAHSDVRRLTTGTLLNGAGAVVTQAVELFVVSVALRRVGAPAYAVVVVAQGLMQLPFLFESGLGQEIVRSTAGRRADGHATVSTAITFYLLLGALGLVGGLVVSHMLLDPFVSPPDDIAEPARRSFDLIVVGGALRLASGFIPRLLVGRTALGRLRAVHLARTFVLLGAVLGLVDNAPSSVEDLGLAILASEVAALLAGIAMVWSFGRALVPGWDRSAVRRHWASSKPMLASSAIAVLGSRLDPFIVSIALGPAATAAYGVAYRAYDTARAGIELVYLGLMPATANAIARGEPTVAAKLFSRAALYAAVAVWPVAAVAAVFAPTVLAVWVGDPPPGSEGAFAAAMAAALVAAVPSAALYVITGAARVGPIVRAQILTVGVNVAIGVSLVTTIGPASVFIGSTTAMLLLSVRYVTEVSRATETDRRTLLTPLVAPGALVLGVGLVALGLRVGEVDGPLFLLSLAAVGVAYAAAAVAFAIPRADLRRLRTLVRH